MTAPGSLAPKTERAGVAAVGTALWTLLPLLTCGLGAPIAFGMAFAKRRTRMTLLGLIVYSAMFATAFGLAGTYGEDSPPWADWIMIPCLVISSLVATLHLSVIRAAVWAPQRPRVPVASVSGVEAVNRARQSRQQARQTALADPMLAKRLGIGRPDLVRQFDDGGLVDLNHAPLHVLKTLPGMTETSARQIRDRVELVGPFTSLGEVLLVVEISPTFEHHLSEYVVFIP